MHAEQLIISCAGNVGNSTALNINFAEQAIAILTI